MKQAAIFVALASVPALVSGANDDLLPMNEVLEKLLDLEGMMIEHGQELDGIKEDILDIREDLNGIEEDLNEIEEGVDDLAEDVEDGGKNSGTWGPNKEDYLRSDSFDGTQEDDDDWEPEEPSSKDDLETHLEDQLERRDMDVDELKDRAEKVFEVVADQRIKDFISSKSEVDTPQERYVLGMELISACLDEMPHDVLLSLVESSLNKRVAKEDRRLVVDSLGPLREEFAMLPGDERRRKAWWEYLIEGIATAAEVAIEIFSEDSSSSD